MMSRSVQSLRRFSISRVVSVTERKLQLSCHSRPYYPATAAQQEHRIAIAIAPPPMRNLRSFSTGGGTSSDDDDAHKLFKEQMEELSDERQELYGFTDEETDSWTKGAGQHKHETSFLEQIERARRAESMGEQERVVDIDPVSPETQEWNVAGSLSHVSQDGKDIRMVDVGHKSFTQRVAVAQSTVVFPAEVMEAFGMDTDGDSNSELVGPKGPIFATAKLAGIMAAKKTSELIPLCHALPLDQVNIDIRLENGNRAVIRCECRVTHKTGVEMEALTGASIAALTIYDMTKAVSHQIRIEQTMLISKTGGKRTVGPEE